MQRGTQEGAKALKSCDPTLNLYSRISLEN